MKSGTHAPIDIQRWAHFEMAKRDVARIACAMHQANIPMTVLKGMSLIAGYGRDAAHRLISDADLLFRSSDYARAEKVLRDLGLRQRESGFSAKVYVGDSNHIMLDIHRYPLPILMGKMTFDRLVKRGQLDTAWFDAPVIRIAHEDFALHLILNFLKDGCPPAYEKRLEQDLLAVLNHTSPDAIRGSAEFYQLQIAAWLTVDWMVERGFNSLTEVAQTLKPASLLNQYRGRALRRAIFRLSEKLPELSYALTRASADALPYALGSAALSGLRVARDFFGPTPQNPARRPMKMPQ